MKRRTLASIIGALAVALVIAALIIGRAPASNTGTRADVPAATPGYPSAQQGGKEAPATTPTPFALPRSSPRAPLISAPLPKAATARGTVVAGFPRTVISLPPRSTVIFSSVSSEGSRLQAGLEATSSLAPKEVIAYYRKAFSALGLVANTAPAVAGSTAWAFVRDASTITVTTAPDPSGGSRYSVHGALSLER
jgi:hypothetical protein